MARVLLGTLACVALLTDVSIAADFEDEPARWGDADFWVKLTDLEVSEGDMKPEFDPDHADYEVRISNQLTTQVSVSLNLDRMKYDIENPPEILVDGKKLDYKIINGISFKVPLEKIAAYDKVWPIELRDPKPNTGWFAGSGASMTYKLRIMQPAIYEKVVRASAITVYGADHRKIESDPPFKNSSHETQYHYALKESDDKIQVKLECSEEATGQAYDGERSDKDSIKTVDVMGATAVTLAQCQYSDEEWTKGQIQARTYQLSFHRESNLKDTKVSLDIMPAHGYCNRVDAKDVAKGFVCRAFEEQAPFVVDNNNSVAEMLLVNDDTHVHNTMVNSLPTMVTIAAHKRSHYTLVMQAGKHKKTYPVEIIWPALCAEGFKCPWGWTLKSSLRKRAKDKLCSKETCTEEDVDNCCDKGSSFEVELCDNQKIDEDTSKAIAKAADISESEAGNLAQSGTILESATNENAERLANALAHEGVCAQSEGERFSAFDVVLEKPCNGVEADSYADDICFKDIDDFFHTLPAPFLKNLPGEKAHGLAEQLKASGCKAKVAGSSAKFGVMLQKVGPNKDKVVKYLAELFNKNVDDTAASIAHDELPTQVTEGANKAMVRIQTALERVGATATVKKATATCETYSCPKGKLLVSRPQCVECKTPCECSEDDEDICCFEEPKSTVDKTTVVDDNGVPFQLAATKICSGRDMMMRQCPDLPSCDPCVPQDCELDAWSAWSEGGCTGLCTRHRGVVKRNNECGEPCSGTLIDTKECKANCMPEPKDGKLGEWESWSECTSNSSAAQRYRSRSIKVEATEGGKPVFDAVHQTEGCTENSRHDAAVSEWSEWSKCDAACGQGQQTRSRKVVREADPGHKGFIGDLKETKACVGLKPCVEDVDCAWSDWVDWTGCSCSCGGGSRERQRYITTAPRGKGKLCEAWSKREVGACNTQSCSACVDGKWAGWSEWEKCTATCEGGVRWRNRKMERQASECGEPVVGVSQEYESCNVGSCSRPNDCEFGEWTEWSGCSCSCDGWKERSRSIAVQGSGGGKLCNGPLKMIDDCNVGAEKCDSVVLDPVDCVVSDWSPWSKCKASTGDCGMGQRSRTRHIVTERVGTGKACEGSLEELAECNSGPCHPTKVPLDCMWGSWGSWGACTKCSGEKQRYRRILMHALNGGAPCESGASLETTNCTRQCHEAFYCTWSLWADWGKCSTTCGSGSQMRIRQLLAAPAPDDLADETIVRDFLQDVEVAEANHMKDVVLAFGAGGVTLLLVLSFSAIVKRVSRSSVSAFHRPFFMEVSEEESVRVAVVSHWN